MNRPPINDRCMGLPSAQPRRTESRTSESSVLLLQDMTARSYWTAVAVACIGYLAIWLCNFGHVYGWVMDDRVIFIKGMDTVRDWKGAFSYYNALQPYFYIVSYLPLKLGISLPSYPLRPLVSRRARFDSCCCGRRFCMG